MTNRDERIATLKAANDKRFEAKRSAVEKAVERFLRTQRRVSVSAIAKEADVSRNFVYAQEDLLERIRQATADESHRMARPAKTPSTEASLRRRLATALDEISALKARNSELEAKVERLTGEVARLMAQPSGGAAR